MRAVGLVLAALVCVAAAPVSTPAHGDHRSHHRRSAYIHPVPRVVTETDSGDVEFTVSAAGLPVGTSWTLHAPGLDAACNSDTLSGTTGTADPNGRFYLAAAASGCNPGRYQVLADQTAAPYSERTSWLVIRPPATLGRHASVFAVPHWVVEDTAGDAAFTLIGRDLPPGTSYSLGLPALIAACGSAVAGPGPLTADYNGNIAQFVAVTGCVPGRYVVTLDEVEAPSTEYAVTITIAPPSQFKIAHAVRNATAEPVRTATSYRGR